jgi:genome maintenance exonuclease 1
LGYDRQKVSFDQVSFGMPINGDDDIVQVDFELSRSLEWSRFAKYSPDYRKDESKYKGHVRNILMMCIVKYCFKKTIKRVTLDDDTVVDGEIEAYVVRLADGLYKTRKNWFAKNGVNMKKTENLMHEYDELIADTPQGFIDLIFNDGKIEDFISFETLFDTFMSDKFKFPENRERILVGVVMSLDSQGIEIPTEIPQEYVDKAREKEKFAQEREALNNGGRDKRKIKHIETFESFAVRAEEDMINEGVVVKQSRGGMKIIREDGTESVLPSITKVLDAMDDKKWLEDWKARVGETEANTIKKSSGNRGSMLHYLLNWYYSGLTDREKMRSELDIKYPKYTAEAKDIAMRLFDILYNDGTLDSIKDVDSIERAIYCLENGGFWGKTDFVSTKTNGKKVIIDFKSSRSIHTKTEKVKKYKLQLAGYWLAWRETMGEELDGCELWIVHEDSDVPDLIELNGSELKTNCDRFLEMVAKWHELYAKPVEAVLGVNEMKNIISFDKFILEN